MTTQKSTHIFLSKLNKYLIIQALLTIIGVILVATAAFAFGGHGSGRKATTFQGGADAIGVHFGGKVKARIDLACPKNASSFVYGLCLCDQSAYIVSNKSCVPAPTCPEGFYHDFEGNCISCNSFVSAITWESECDICANSEVPHTYDGSHCSTTDVTPYICTKNGGFWCTSTQSCVKDENACTTSCPQARMCGETCCAEGHTCQNGMCCDEDGNCCPSGSVGYNAWEQQCCPKNTYMVASIDYATGYGSGYSFPKCCPSDSPGYAPLSFKCCDIDEKLMGWWCCPMDTDEVSLSTGCCTPDKTKIYLDDLLVCCNEGQDAYCTQYDMDGKCISGACCSGSVTKGVGIGGRDICCPRNQYGYCGMRDPNGECLNWSGVGEQCCTVEPQTLGKDSVCCAEGTTLSCVHTDEDDGECDVAACCVEGQTPYCEQQFSYGCDGACCSGIVHKGVGRDGADVCCNDDQELSCAEYDEATGECLRGACCSGGQQAKCSTYREDGSCLIAICCDADQEAYSTGYNDGNCCNGTVYRNIDDSGKDICCDGSQQPYCTYGTSYGDFKCYSYSCCSGTVHKGVGDSGIDLCCDEEHEFSCAAYDDNNECVIGACCDEGKQSSCTLYNDLGECISAGCCPEGQTAYCSSVGDYGRRCYQTTCCDHEPQYMEEFNSYTCCDEGQTPYCDYGSTSGTCYSGTSCCDGPVYTYRRGTSLYSTCCAPDEKAYCASFDEMGRCTQAACGPADCTEFCFDENDDGTCREAMCCPEGTWLSKAEPGAPSDSSEYGGYGYGYGNRNAMCCPNDSDGYAVSEGRCCEADEILMGWWCCPAGTTEFTLSTGCCTPDRTKTYYNNGTFPVCCDEGQKAYCAQRDMTGECISGGCCNGDVTTGVGINGGDVCCSTGSTGYCVDEDSAGSCRMATCCSGDKVGMCSYYDDSDLCISATCCNEGQTAYCGSISYNGRYYYCDYGLCCDDEAQYVAEFRRYACCPAGQTPYCPSGNTYGTCYSGMQCCLGNLFEYTENNGYQKRTVCCAEGETAYRRYWQYEDYYEYDCCAGTLYEGIGTNGADICCNEDQEFTCLSQDDEDNCILGICCGAGYEASCTEYDDNTCISAECCGSLRNQDICCEAGETPYYRWGYPQCCSGQVSSEYTSNGEDMCCNSNSRPYCNQKDANGSCLYAGCCSKNNTVTEFGNRAICCSANTTAYVSAYNDYGSGYTQELSCCDSSRTLTTFDNVHACCSSNQTPYCSSYNSDGTCRRASCCNTEDNDTMTDLGDISFCCSKSDTAYCSRRDNAGNCVGYGYGCCSGTIYVLSTDDYGTNYNCCNTEDGDNLTDFETRSVCCAEGETAYCYRRENTAGNCINGYGYSCCSGTIYVSSAVGNATYSCCHTEDGNTLTDLGDISVCCDEGGTGYISHKDGDDIETDCCSEDDTIIRISEWDDGNGYEQVCCPSGSIGWDSWNGECCEEGSTVIEDIHGNTHCCPEGSTGWANWDGCCEEGSTVIEDINGETHCCPEGSTGWDSDNEECTTSSCPTGYTGTNCDTCIEGVSRSTRDGTCSICDNGNVYLSYMDDPCATTTSFSGCKSNDDCDEGEYCKLTGSSCDYPDAGTCTAIGSNTPATITGLGNVIKSDADMSWWAAKNWCQAQGMRLPTIEEIQCYRDGTNTLIEAGTEWGYCCKGGNQTCAGWSSYWNGATMSNSNYVTTHYSATITALRQAYGSPYTYLWTASDYSNSCYAFGVYLNDGSVGGGRLNANNDALCVE